MKKIEPITPSIQRKRLSQVFLAIAFILVFLAGNSIGISFERNKNDLNLTKFWQAYDLVKQNYAGSIDKQKLVDGAVKGLVEALDDPYSAYLPPKDKKDLSDDLNGSFEGIGAELTDKNGLITVVAPIKDSPAEKVGIKPNDVITKINGESTEDLTVSDAVTKIRGQKGTQVTLTIFRKDTDKELEFKITRQTIRIDSVTSKMIGNIGYVEITQFGSDTVDITTEAVKEIAKQNPKAIIIDLRNNPGGYLYSVPPIAGLFLPPSVIVKEKYRDGKTDELKSTNVPVLPKTPMYVIINSGSASASEILAGALQDYKRATIVGTKSFGKGSVQDLLDLPGGSALRITIAEWLTPNGRAINKVGITPDIKIEGEKSADKDPVLDKVLELINKI